MKRIITLILIALTVNLVFPELKAQYPKWDDPNNLPKWMTPEEELRRHEIGQGTVRTLPPVSPVRSISEFERMQGALIRYHNGLGIPISLVVAISQHTKVYTLAANQTQRTAAFNAYQAAGANMSNCEFIIASTNSIWTRDYGPFWIINGDNQICVLDFPYNRPRPLDDAIPGHVANYLGIPMYTMSVVHAGGNFMSTGWGIGASTDLVYEENGNNVTWVNQQMLDYAGIHTYHVTIDPLGEYIKHIDCWAKFLDVDKILIAQVPPTHPRYWAYEQVTSYFENQMSDYGTPFQIYRVFTPNGQPYTNSLILNHRVYVPTTNSIHDAAALAVYQQALPGYEVIGVFSTSWQSTDALHCRVKEIADINMLSVRHIPLHGLHEYQPEFDILAEIIAHSGAEIYSDSLFIIYKANMGTFDTVPLSHVMDHTFGGMIPVAPGDTLITYYLSAADASGRKETWPLIGAPGARSFRVTLPPDVMITPDSLVFITFEQAFVDGLELVVNNPSGIGLTVDEIISQQWNCYFYPEPELPYTIAPGEALVLNVFLDPGVGIYRDMFVHDTIKIIGNFPTHQVPVWVNPDLISGVQQADQTLGAFRLYPNPSANYVNVGFTLNQSNHLILEIFDLQGRRIASLLDEFKQADQYSIVWDIHRSGRIPEGVYLVRLIAGKDVMTKRVIVTK